ncbi:MAG: membrane lipoprotein lipid attachment site-containing protein [Bacilli bacterium]|nr:membrane lipoprotein lipid attachment site-containing protein [Bacilli bacterium]
MKKIFLVLSIITVFLLSGCNDTLNNTPTKQVEMFLDNYKTLNDDVLSQLDEVVERENLFDDDSKEDYKDIMKTHYKNLKYEIKDETVNGNQATVSTEIEVTDYSKIMSDANKYLADHRDEFNDKTGKYDETLFTKYRLDKLKDAKDTVKYTIDFQLTKKSGKWMLENLTDEQEAKINGMYTY